MGIFDYDPWEVNGVHYASTETYERAKKRAKRSAARQATDDWYRGHMEEKRAAKRDQDAAERLAAADRRARLQADRHGHELTVEQEKTRREELRLERARTETERKESARLDRERSAREREEREEARRTALSRAQGILDRGAGEWSHPARIDLLDARCVPDHEAAARAEAGPEPEPAFDASLPGYSVVDAWLRAGWGTGGVPGPGFGVCLSRPQSWWPQLASETEARPEDDMTADRDRIAREALAAGGMDPGWERSLLPKRKAAWKDAYARAFWEAEVQATRPCLRAQQDNDLVRQCLSSAAAATAGSLLDSMRTASSVAARAASNVRADAAARARHNSGSAEVFAAMSEAYPGLRGEWDGEYGSVLSDLSGLVSLYESGDRAGTESYLASAAAWPIEPYTQDPVPVAASWDPESGHAAIDVTLPELIPPPCTARFPGPAADSIELVPGSASRQSEMTASALAELPVRIAVEAMRKDHLGRVSSLTVNVWDRGIDVGGEIRGVACLSTLTADRPLAAAYDGNSAGFLRAAVSRSGKAGGVEPVITSVSGGTLVPTPVLPLWSRDGE